jgi:hypothetical protein
MDQENIHIVLDNYTLDTMRMIKDKETALSSINRVISSKEHIRTIKEADLENIISQMEKGSKENTKMDLHKDLESIIF